MRAREIIEKVQVNIPVRMLHASYLETFLRYQINPEVGLDAQALDQLEFSDYETIALQLQEAGLKVTLHAPFLDLSPGSPDPKIWEATRERFEQVLRVIPLFRPVTVVCHTGYDSRVYGYLREDWFERSLEFWTWFGKGTADQGASLMLENVYEQGPEEVQGLLEALRGLGVGFCLDTGHQSAFGQAPLSAWVSELGSFIGQVHLHDNSGEGDEHLALGRGIVDFVSLLSSLRHLGGAAPVVTLEPHTEADLWPSLAYLAKIWPW
jgi:sugar phosphate isomerase/epimerase